jgi:thioredoxin 1
MTEKYLAPGPTREEIDRISGAAVLEFGTDWCGYCRAAERIVQQALAEHPGVLHLKVEDGPGRRLGRSFKIKLWPTLIFLRDGRELARSVRPTSVDELRSCLQILLDASTTS